MLSDVDVSGHISTTYSGLSVMVWWQVLERLPVVDIRWRHPHLVQAKPKALEGGIEGAAAPGQEYQVEVQLRRVGGKKSGSGLARVYAPRFPKVHTMIYFLLMHLLSGSPVQVCCIASLSRLHSPSVTVLRTHLSCRKLNAAMVFKCRTGLMTQRSNGTQVMNRADDSTHVLESVNGNIIN